MDHARTARTTSAQNRSRARCVPKPGALRAIAPSRHLACPRSRHVVRQRTARSHFLRWLGAVARVNRAAATKDCSRVRILASHIARQRSSFPFLVRRTTQPSSRIALQTARTMLVLRRVSTLSRRSSRKSFRSSLAPTAHPRKETTAIARRPL